MFLDLFIKAKKDKDTGIVPRVHCADGRTFNFQADEDFKDTNLLFLSCRHHSISPVHPLFPKLIGYQVKRDTYDNVPLKLAQELVDYHGGIVLPKEQKQWRKELAEDVWASRRFLRKQGRAYRGNLRGDFFGSGDVYFRGNLFSCARDDEPNVVEVSLGSMGSMSVLRHKSRTNELYEMAEACERVLRRLEKFAERGNYQEDNEQSRHYAALEAAEKVFRPTAAAIKWSVRTIDECAVKATRGAESHVLMRRGKDVFFNDVCVATIRPKEEGNLLQSEFVSAVRAFVNRNYAC